MRRILSILTLIALLAPIPASALNSTSTSFYIRQNIQDTSGGSNTWSFSTSTSFKLLSAGGQTAVGTSSPGTEFTVHGGFLRNLFKSVKPVYTLEHYHWRRNDGSETTATAIVAEDTATTSVQKNEPQRLRIALSNEGGTEAQYTTEEPRLEYGLKVTTCEDIVSWTNVGAVAGDWDMHNTVNLTDADDTTNISTATGGVTDPNRTFITNNNGVKDAQSTLDPLLIPSDSFVEMEFSIKALSAATDGGTYCFRITDAGTDSLYSYTIYPEATLEGGNSLPVASAVSIDSGATSVTLIENTTQNVVCAGTVTDNDGFANITAVGGFLYRTSLGTSSASDANNLYRQYGDSQCVPSGGSGLSETYTCTFPVEFYADPTDAGSPYSADTWSCELHPRDAVATGTPAVDTVEMASLMALDVTSTIPYGSVSANTDSGSTNQQTVVTNTGNRDMDPEVSGSSMTGAGTIASSQQKYLAAAFTYSGGGTSLSGTPTQVDLNLPQPGVLSSVPPTFIQESETAWDAVGSPNTTPSFDVLAGDVLVAIGLSGSDAIVFGTPSGGSLTWTLQENINVSAYAELSIWTAIVDSNKTMSVSVTNNGVQNGINVFTFRGSDGIGAAEKDNQSSGAPTLNITTTQDNSAIVVANADWNAGDGSSRTWRTNAGSFTEQTYDLVTGEYTPYAGYHADAGSTGTYAVGLSTPSGQKYSIGAVEVLGTQAESETITDTLFWGLGVPNGTPNGSYTGTNTFTAAAGI